MFKGLLTALITPFTQGRLDEEGLRLLLQRQLDAHVDGIVLLGTTGEAATLSEAEKVRVLEIGLEEVKGKTTLIAGTGSNATEKAVHDTKRAYEMGLDGALVVTPYYNKPTQEGIYRHFAAVADASPLPLLVYNIQGRTGVNIEVPTLLRLAHLPHIVGLKEASGNISQIADCLHALPPSWSVLSGDDALALPLIALGGHGLISVVSNLFPVEMKQLVHAALAHDLPTARSWHNRLLPLFRAAFCETNPAPIKAALTHSGLPAGICRLPLVPLQGASEKLLYTTLGDLHGAPLPANCRRS